MKFLAKNYIKTGIYFCISFLFLSFQASAELLEKGKLSIGSDLTYPPYAYMSDNKPAGFDVEFSWVPSLRALSTSYCSKNGKAQLTVNEYDTDPQVTQALRSGTIDVQMSDASVIASVMERFPGQFQVTSHELIYPVLIGIGVGKNNKDISKQISQAFEAVRQDGSYAKLLEKYHFFAPDQNDIDAAINKLK